MMKIAFSLIASLVVPALLSAADAPNDMSIKIKGMVCGECEKKVTTALEKIKGVESVRISHTTGVAVIKVSKDSKVSLDEVKKAVKEASFLVIE